MSLERLFVIITAVACAAIAMAGCDDDDPAAPTGADRFVHCAPVEGKSVTIIVSTGDWTTAVNTRVDPFTGDTTTSFTGTASLGATIPDVNAGDTLCVRVAFSDPLVISATVPPYVSLALGGGTPGGCQSGSSYHAVVEGGDWGVISTNAGVRNSGSCTYPSGGGAIHGYWHNMVADIPTEGSTLYCITTKFRVPATFGSTPIASGQTLPVEFVAWSTQLDGDHSSDPFPVQAQ